MINSSSPKLAVLIQLSVYQRQENGVYTVETAVKLKISTPSSYKKEEGRERKRGWERKRGREEVRKGSLKGKEGGKDGGRKGEREEGRERERKGEREREINHQSNNVVMEY